jgi:hypothetical protein
MPPINEVGTLTNVYTDTELPNRVGFVDDFMNAQAVASITTTTTVFGDTPWTAHDILVAATMTTPNSSFTNPGQATLTTGATGSGDGLGLTKGASPLGVLAANAGWEMHIIFALSQTTLCAIRIGACENGGYQLDPPTDGCWVEYDTANANSNADYTFVTAKASAYNYSISNSKAVDTSFHHVRIRSISAGTILFMIDNGTETVITTDVPTGMLLQPFIQILTRTSASKSLVMDFFSYIAASGRT